MKTEKQFLAECDEREELIALVMSDSKFKQDMIDDIYRFTGEHKAIQFKAFNNAIEICEVTAQGDTINEETGEEGNWCNLEGETRYFVFEDYIGVRGEIFKLEKEFDKLIGKYIECKDALVDTDHHDWMLVDIEGYTEIWFEAKEDVEWIKELIKDLKKQTKAFDNVIKGLNEVSYTFC